VTRHPLALALACALAAPPLHAYCRTTEPPTPPPFCERGDPVAWPVACVGLSLNARGLTAPTPAAQDLSDLLREHLPRAAAAWSEAPCGPSLRLAIAPEVALDEGLAVDGRNTVSVKRRWGPDPYHLPGVLAITVVTTDADTGALLDADVEFNARAPDNPLGYPFGDGAPSWGVADLPSVLLHELGHVVGLAHADRADAVMAAGTGDVERQRRALTPDDARGVCASYPASTSRPRPQRGCVPQRPVAPTIAITGGMGCALSRPVRAHPSLAAAAIVVAAVRRRRRTQRRPIR